MFCSSNDVSRGRIDDYDAVGSRCWDVDVVDPDTSSSNDFEICGCGKDFGSDFGFGADYEGVVGGDYGEELRGGEVFWLVDFLGTVRSLGLVCARRDLRMLPLGEQGHLEILFRG